MATEETSFSPALLGAAAAEPDALAAEPDTAAEALPEATLEATVGTEAEDDTAALDDEAGADEAAALDPDAAAEETAALALVVTPDATTFFC